MILSSVDLPPPDGPVMTTKDPGCDREIDVFQDGDLGAHADRGKHLSLDRDRQRTVHRRHLFALAMSGCRIAISMICTTMMKASA